MFLTHFYYFCHFLNIFSCNFYLFDIKSEPLNKKGDKNEYEYYLDFVCIKFSGL